MKHWVGLFIILFILTSLITACADKPGPRAQVSPTISRVTQISEGDEPNFSLLEEFVSALNDQYPEAALILFNDEATLTEIDQVNMMSNLHQNGWNYTYTGKAEIKKWLEVEIGSNSQIVPVEYKFYGNYLSMNGLLYYQDQVMDLQLIEKSENSKITHFIYYIVKRSFPK